MPPVSTHHMTAHGAASASKSMAALLASGASSDAAGDIAGGDAFAALLAQVTPEAPTPKAGTQGHHKHEDATDGAASDAPDASQDASSDNAQPATGKTPSGAGVNDPSLRADPSQISAATDSDSTDKRKDADAKSELLLSADPSQIPRDDGRTDKTKKADGKSGHHHNRDANKKSDTNTDAQLLAIIPSAVPANTLPTTLAPNSHAASDSDDADGALAVDASNSAVAPTHASKAQGRTAAPNALKAASAKDAQARNTPSIPAADNAPPVDDKIADKSAGQQNAGPPDRQDIDKAKNAPQKNPANGDVKTAADRTATQQTPPAPANAASAAAIQAATPARAAAQSPASAISAVTTPTAPASAPATPMVLHAAPAAPDTTLPNLNSFALDIAAKSHDGLKQFDIRMDPADLGRVDVSLSIDNSGKVQAHLTADQPQTLALLQKDSTNLRSALRDAGLNVAQNGLNFSLKGRNPEQRSARNAQTSRSRSLSIRAVAAVGAAQSVLPAFSTTSPDSRLDIHV